jgi:hypothetical protein
MFFVRRLSLSAIVIAKADARLVRSCVSPHARKSFIFFGFLAFGFGWPDHGTCAFTRRTGAFCTLVKRAYAIGRNLAPLKDGGET